MDKFIRESLDDISETIENKLFLLKKDKQTEMILEYINFIENIQSSISTIKMYYIENDDQDEDEAEANSDRDSDAGQEDGDEFQASDIEDQDYE